MNLQTQLDNLVKEMHLKNYSWQTIKSYKSVLKSFLAIFESRQTPKHISQNDVKDFLSGAKSVSDLKIKIGAVKCYYKYVVHQPMKFSFIEYPRKEKKLPRVMSHEEIVEKLNLIINTKHRAILSLAYCCGLRVSEIVNLKTDHINGKERIILISRAKGFKDRYCPVSEFVLNILRVYYSEYKPKEYLFNGQTSLKYTTRSCQEIFKKYIDGKNSFHSLRHSAFTTMLERGTDLRVIQTVAGHASPNTTAIYTHVSQKFLQSIQTPI